MPAEIDSSAHGREHGRNAEQLRWDEREVAGQERDRDLRRRVVQSTTNLADDPPDSKPHRYPAERADEEEPARVHRREGPGHDSRDSDPIQHETGAVVHQA